MILRSIHINIIIVSSQPEDFQSRLHNLEQKKLAEIQEAQKQQEEAFQEESASQTKPKVKTHYNCLYDAVFGILRYHVILCNYFFSPEWFPGDPK